MKKNSLSSSANFLLDRTPDQEYIEEWTLLIQKEKLIKKNQTEFSVVLFRLNAEWFALNTTVFAEIAAIRTFHRIPHRSSPLLLGFVNIRGQIFVCLSMHYLLGVPCVPESFKPIQNQQCQRLLAIRKDEVKFTFIADEVFSVHHCNESLLQLPPVTISKSKDNYLKGIFNWQNHNVGLLDEILIFQSLQRKICEQ